MLRTTNEYQRRWRDVMRPGCVVAPWDEPLRATSCVIHESSRSLARHEGLPFFRDFGDAICFYRYHRIPDELDTVPTPGSDVAALLPDLARQGWSWRAYRMCYRTEEIRRRRYEGERALDKLLGRYVREGYQPDMGAKLIEIVHATLLDFEARAVYILPDDLGPLLAKVGNPLAGCPSGDGAAVAFDLNAAGHREALAEHLLRWAAT